MDYDDIINDDDMSDEIIMEIIRENSYDIMDSIRSKFKDSEAYCFNPQIIIDVSNFEKWLNLNFENEIEIEFKTDFMINCLTLIIKFDDLFESLVADFIHHLSKADSFFIAKTNDDKICIQISYKDWILFSK